MFSWAKLIFRYIIWVPSSRVTTDFAVGPISGTVKLAELEKLTGLQLVKKFPAFYGTRRFITELTIVRSLSLFCASPIQSTFSHANSWRSILILFTHLQLGLPSCLFPSGFPTKNLYDPSAQPYVPHAQPISFSILSSAQYPVSSTLRAHVLFTSW